MAPEQIADAPVRALCRIAETYGRGICREPQRLEAMLHDLCPNHKREIFLLVSALKEQVVADLIESRDGLPEPMVVARSRHRLSANLGLTEDSARWAVESWLSAARILAARPDVPLRFAEQAARLDWLWMSLCAASILCCALAVANVSYFSLHHAAATFRSWITETGLFALGLAIPGAALAVIARQLAKRPVPDNWSLSATIGAATMLADLLTVLALPLVPVLTVALWAGEWAQAWHSSGQPHDLSFHLGRILQSIFLALFLWQWFIATVAIQAHLGASAIGRRS